MQGGGSWSTTIDLGIRGGAGLNGNERENLVFIKKRRMLKEIRDPGVVGGFVSRMDLTSLVACRIVHATYPVHTVYVYIYIYRLIYRVEPLIARDSLLFFLEMLKDPRHLSF